MARVAGVDLPREKRGEVAVTYIYGIGRPTATRILGKANVDPAKKVKAWSDEETARVRELIAATGRVADALRPIFGARLHETPTTAQLRADDLRAFLAGGALIAGILSSVAAGLYPQLLPSRPGSPHPGLDIYNAASPEAPAHLARRVPLRDGADHHLSGRHLPGLARQGRAGVSLATVVCPHAHAFQRPSPLGVTEQVQRQRIGSL